MAGVKPTSGACTSNIPDNGQGTLRESVFMPEVSDIKAGTAVVWVSGQTMYVTLYAVRVAA
jgi:hypothetical protein